MHQSHRAANGARQAQLSWKTARIFLACSSIVLALLVFGSCGLPLAPTNAGHLPTTTVAPTPPATPTDAEIQTDVNANKHTLQYALELAQKGTSIFSETNQTFLDKNGNRIPSGAAKSGDNASVPKLHNVIYAGQLINAELQPVQLFATLDASEKNVVFVGVQFYSPKRDDKTLDKFQKNDKFDIQTQDIQVMWQIGPYDPSATEYTGSTLFPTISDVGSKFITGASYNLDLVADQKYYTDYSQPGTSAPQGDDNQLVESYGDLEGALSIDSIPANIATINMLKNGGTVPGADVLTPAQMRGILQTTSTGDINTILFPDFTGITPQAIEAGN